MVSLIFLLAIIADNRFSRSTLAVMIGPFLGLSAVWLITISTVIGSGTRLLTPIRIFVILAGYAGIGILIWGQKFRWVKKASHHAMKITFWAAAILLVILFVLRPDHMLESTINLIRNLLIYGRWGFTWYVVILLLLLSNKEDPIPYKNIFHYGLPTYFLFILSLSFLRLPYHPNWWDSANRMMTHLLPATLFYLSLRYAPGIKQNVTTQLSLDGS
jgi:hypothetical protein